MGFVHLHNHSQFTILNGMPSPPEIVSAAEKLGMPAVAITDTCNLFGAVQFHKAAKKSSVKAIFGSEIWMWPKGIEDIKNIQRLKRAPDGGWHLNFLVQNKTGYHNLSKLITEGIYHGIHYRPRIDWDLLEEHSEGLMVTTSGLNGPLGYALSQKNTDSAAHDILERLANIFGEQRLFLELQDFAIPHQSRLNELSRRMAQKMGLKTVVTNDVRYLEPQDAVSLDLLNCISFGQGFHDSDRQTMPTDQQYFKSEEEMRELFPDDQEAIDRTIDIADACNFKFDFGTYFFPATTPPDADKLMEDGTTPKMNQKEYWADTQANWEYFYKAFPPPRSFQLPDPKVSIPQKPQGIGNMSSYFEWYCKEGLIIRLGVYDTEKHAKYWERLDFEMNIIESMGFPAYMLIVAEFINWSKDNDIPVGPGRGSAAGSLVAWAMGITDIDPLRYSLLFERFLNPERVSMPDIDVDFCQDRREEAIEHVREVYGPPLVSQIITYGKLAAKAAVKDIARSLGVPFGASNELTGMVPDKPGTKLKDALAEEGVEPRLALNPLYNRVFKLALNIEGKTRQTGIHAAGVVIADRPLVEHAPLYRDGPEGGPVVQYDMKSSESLGLIKFDFLGLKTLDQIRDALVIIKENHNVDVDMENLPTDASDPAYTLLQKGDSIGVFQLESEGMQKLLESMQPESLEDVIASIALFRPGPLSSGMDQTFVRRKNGLEPVEYLHPKLEQVLQNTYGSIVYQEQVMQIAQVMSDYSLGEADLLRRAMGKKDMAEMDRQKIIFVKRAVKNDVKEATAAEIFDLMAFFAGYGFNKSHSAAYGWISYQTAWLKAHYRPEYMAALMTSESGNTDKVFGFIQDCKFPRRGTDFTIEVKNPDINKSNYRFFVPKPTPDAKQFIQFGLVAVKGLGKRAIQVILRERHDRGPFTSFFDFLDRVVERQTMPVTKKEVQLELAAKEDLSLLDPYFPVSKKVYENLIKCGAFDSLYQSRKSLLAALPNALEHAQDAQKERDSGQLSLFGDMMEVSIEEFKVPHTGDWSIQEQMKQEKIALGLYLTDHPITAYKKWTSECSTTNAARAVAHGEFRVAGMATYYPQTNKHGKPYGRIILEDQDGSIRINFYGKVYDRLLPIIQSGGPMIVHLEKTTDETFGPSYRGLNATSLLSVQEDNTTRINISMPQKALTHFFCQDMAQLLEANPGDCPVDLELKYTKSKESATFTLRLKQTVNPTETLLLDLKKFVGDAKRVTMINR